MFRQAFIVMILVLVYTLACGQKSKARIDNYRVESTEKQLIISFDLKSEEPGSLHQIDLVVINNIGEVVYPDSLSGDIGPGISAGNQKQIIWSIYQEFDVIYGDFQPQLILDGNQKYGFKGGPEYLLLSLMVPGLGDYFVADHRSMTIKPYYKTAFTFGMLGLAWAAKAGREQIPAVMAPPGWYRADLSEGTTNFVYKDDWWVKVPEQTDYWLFRYDAEVFLGIGLAAWITDVIWVARQGKRNNQIRSNLFDHLSVAPAPKGIMFNFAYQF